MLPLYAYYLTPLLYWLSLGSTRKLVKKAFVMVGTCLSDRHGEDNPGDGRLLLFGLDYHRFQATAPGSRDSRVFIMS